MDCSRLSSQPHHSWLSTPFVLQQATAVVLEQRQTTHMLVIGTREAADIRWICRGSERAYHHGLDQVSFFNADDEDHTRLVRPTAVPSSANVLLIPKGHLDDMGTEDQAGPPGECRSFRPRVDAKLRDCLSLLCATSGRQEVQDIGSEIAARRLVCRLLEILGGRTPDWCKDSNVFTTRETDQIVEYIDSRLHARHQFCLEEIAVLVGLSPSHCAKKFRLTTGVSLGRFINRRRVAMAMLVLRKEETSLAEMAFDLGFSSQSHLTRLFSDLTGVTPAKYRKQFRRTVG